MKALQKLAHLGVALTAFSLSLTAMDLNPDLDLKIRTGLTAGTITKDLQDNKALGLAVGATFKITETGSITVDLGYDYLPGRETDGLPSSAAPIWYNFGTAAAPNIQNNFNGHPLFVAPGNGNGSADSHKCGFEGFSLRVGYLAPLPWLQQLSWRAGLSLDRYKSTNQFVGNLVPLYTDAEGTVQNLGADAYEGWAYSRQRNAFNVGCFAGLTYQVHENHKVEFTVRNVGYGVMSYQPLAYTGKAAQLSDKNGRGWVFELGLTVKL